jgi:hypothetical protein
MIATISQFFRKKDYHLEPFFHESEAIIIIINPRVYIGKYGGGGSAS